MHKYPHIMEATALLPWTPQQKYFRSGMAALINPRAQTFCFHTMGLLQGTEVTDMMCGPSLDDPIKLAFRNGSIECCNETNKTTFRHATLHGILESVQFIGRKLCLERAKDLTHAIVHDISTKTSTKKVQFSCLKEAYVTTDERGR
eukprot:TRINITY_DN10247_c0_g1_i3.p1 TRINITY_DN10247_c0_g1~~TRINITY_DN10247_c0_g1_i3.p1  ORF type:complete len:146 (-),score=22.48 TRINITY_DN10247_c0_g1_i3:17-454(-)